MVIEFHPSSLKSISTFDNAKRRFKNREGFATFKNTQGEETTKPIEGPILKICKTAVEYNAQYPEHIIDVFENNCGASGIPNPLP